MNLEKEDKIISDKLNEYIEFDAFDKHEVWNRIEDQLSKRKKKKFPILRYVSIAALMILFVGIYIATIQSKNNFQKGTLIEKLVKSEPHSINADTPYTNFAASSPKNAKNGKFVIVEYTTKSHLNISNKSSVVSTKSTNIDIQEPMIEKANSVTVLENQASINLDSKASIASSPLVVVYTKNIPPKHKYTIVHINELGRSDDGIPAFATITKEKIVLASYPPMYSYEQEAVQKYLSIKLFSNKSSNSLNNDHEK